ncbi:MAG: TonB-dependent receptor [Thiohalobacteraceae bacterium]
MKQHALLPVRRRVALVLLFCLSSGSVSAAPEDSGPDMLAGEDYFFDQVPVVLSATRLAQPQYEAPVAVSVIDRSMIEASGALDIPDLLRLVPGFQVAHAKGHTASATYHGLADEHARRMQVLVDGRPVYGPALGGVRWTDLPLDVKDVERIEVVRGPNSAAFGSNAFLGAINIITQHPTQLSGTELSLLRGNKDTSKALLRHGDRMGKLDYRMTLGYRRAEGFKARTDLGPPEPSKGTRYYRDPLNDGMRVSLFNVRGSYQLSAQDSLEFMGGYNGGPRGEGEFGAVVDAPRDREVQSHFQQIVWRRSPSPDQETRVQFYHTYMKHSERTEALLSEIAAEEGVPFAYVLSLFPGHTDEQVTTDFGVSEERFEVEGQQSFSMSPATRLVWGAGARLDRVGGKDWYDRDDLIESRLYRVFGNLEWRAYAAGTVNLGAMLENSSLVGTQLSPRVALNHQVNTDHGVRASVSRALRLPTIYEDRASGTVSFNNGDLINRFNQGNPDLSPERMVSYELGYLGRIPRLHTTLDIKLFHDRLKDRISAPKNHYFPDLDNKMFLFTNTGSLLTNGVEATLSYRPEKRTMLLFNWAYAKAKGKALNSYANPLAQPKPSRIRYEDLGDDVPTHTYSLFGMHRLPGQVDISALYYRVGAMQWLGDGDRHRQQDRLDLRVAKHFQYAGTRSSLALVVQNALDEYMEFREDNVFDTRVYVELALALP